MGRHTCRPNDNIFFCGIKTRQKAQINFLNFQEASFLSLDLKGYLVFSCNKCLFHFIDIFFFKIYCVLFRSRWAFEMCISHETHARKIVSRWDTWFSKWSCAGKSFCVCVKRLVHSVNTISGQWVEWLGNLALNYQSIPLIRQHLYTQMTI